MSSACVEVDTDPDCLLELEIEGMSPADASLEVISQAYTRQLNISNYLRNLSENHMDYMNEIERAKAVTEQAINDAKRLADKLPDGLLKVEALTLVSQLVQASIILNIRRPAVPCRLDFVSVDASKPEAIIPDVHADSFMLTDHYSQKSGQAFIRFDPTATQSARFNPIQNIKYDADFVMSMLVKMTQITLLPEQFSLAKAVALRESDKGELTLLSVIEAFEIEPQLHAFGAKLREVALPGAYGKLFDPLAR